MFKRVVKNTLVGILLITIVLFNGTANALESGLSNEQIDFNNYPEDTRERYVASLALKENISYEEADKLEKQETSLLHSPNEYVRYKTVDKYAGKVCDGAKYSESVYVVTEVKYVWNKTYNELVNIENVGAYYLYIPEVLYLEINGGDINRELYSKSARISQTCSLVYGIKSVKVRTGGDIASVSRGWKTYKITTKVNTFALAIKESDLI